MRLAAASKSCVLVSIRQALIHSRDKLSVSRLHLVASEHNSELMSKRIAMGQATRRARRRRCPVACSLLLFLVPPGSAFVVELSFTATATPRFASDPDSADDLVVGEPILPKEVKASFGDVVPLKRLGNASNVSSAKFGESVPLRRPDALEDNDAKQALDGMRKRNGIVAVMSIAFALTNWFWSFFHPIDSIELLVAMERDSPELSVIAKNGKPTVVDFWAPWYVAPFFPVTALITVLGATSASWKRLH